MSPEKVPSVAPAPPAQPVAPVPKKGLSTAAKVWIGIGIGCFVVIVITIIAVVAGGFWIFKQVEQGIQTLGITPGTSQVQGGTEVTVNQTITKEGYIFSVFKYTDNYPNPNFPKAGDGKRYILFDVEIKNAGTSSLTPFINFTMKGKNGTEGVFALTAAEPDFLSDLPAGETKRAYLGFQLPIGEAPGSITFEPVLDEEPLLTISF